MADPFTTSVILAGVEAAASEMFETLRKTAMSPIIYEVLDVGTGVLDAKGELIASGAGIPGFIGVLDKSVKAILAQEKQPISDGDIFVLNDPNTGGVTHLNDVVVAAPVFYEQVLIAWVASIAHWGDIGGKTAGSMAVDVAEIFAEGLRIPPVRLFRKGVRSDAVADIIAANSRLPEFVFGDLAAQLAAGRRGHAAVIGIVEKYGMAAFDTAIAEGFATGEDRARQGLARLPKGQITMNAAQDDGAIWTVHIDISDAAFTIDLRDAPAAVAGPHNTSRDGAMVVCQMFFKALTDPERYANAGSFAPLRVLTQEGTIFHAGPTDPQGYYFETRIRLFDLLWRAIAQVMPRKLPAGHFATIFGTVLAGNHPDTGRRYTLVEPQMGGWGATSDRPGTGPLFSTSHGDTFNCPAEIAEARYGLEVLERSLVFADMFEAGHAGGPGVRTRYLLRAPAQLSAGLSHSVVPVWSQNEAPPGGLNTLRIRSAGNAEKTYSFVGGLKLDAGDEIDIQTSCGGHAAKVPG